MPTIDVLTPREVPIVMSDVFSPAQLKTVCRLFDNEQADTAGVLAPHIEQTLRRMKQYQWCLQYRKPLSST
jgi:hypothetical protein